MCVAARMSSEEECDLRTLLVHAISSYDIELVEKLLESGVDSSAHLHDGTSPIHLAAVLDDPTGCTIVSRMLDYGADPNVQTNSGLTPLHIAAMWGRVRTVDVLLDNGASAFLKDDEDQSALDYAEGAEENRDECIDALTRYRQLPLRKFKNFENLPDVSKKKYLLAQGTVSTSSQCTESSLDKENIHTPTSPSNSDKVCDQKKPDQVESNVTEGHLNSSEVTFPQLDGIPVIETSFDRKKTIFWRDPRNPNYLSDSDGSNPGSARSSFGYAGDVSEFPTSGRSSDESLDETFWSVWSSQPVSSSSREPDKNESLSQPSGRKFSSRTPERERDQESFATPATVPRKKPKSNYFIPPRRPFQKTSSTNREKPKSRMCKNQLQNGNELCADSGSSHPNLSDNVHDGSLIKNLSCVLRDEDVASNSDMSEKYHVSQSQLMTEATIDYSGNTPLASNIAGRRNSKESINQLESGSLTRSGSSCDVVDNMCPLERQPAIDCVTPHDLKCPSFLHISSLPEVEISVSDDGDDILRKRRRSMKELETVNIDYDWMDISQVSATEPSEESVCLSMSILTLSNKELRERLIKVGECPGPVTDVTRTLYQRYLARIEKNNDRLLKPQDKFKDFPAETRLELLGPCSMLESHRGGELEMEMSYVFVNPEKHTWREGTQKTSFNYLLLDPRVTKNLPERAKDLNFLDQFRCFTAAIFYIGKGKKSRPYEHFHETLKFQPEKGKPASNKVNAIRNIWEAGFGVVSVHVYHSVIPVEAYTREGCMIEAMGLGRLCNAKRGEFYGPASSWSGKKRRLLGIFLIQKAMKIYLLEGERQIRPADLRK